MALTINDIKAYKILSDKDSDFKQNIINIFNYAYDVLPKINHIFPTYTGHGIDHSIKVANYMFDLCDFPEKLSDLELVAIIYVALLHDIGMAVNHQEIEEIKSDQRNLFDRKYSEILKKLGNEQLALQEFIRPIHGERSQNHILEKMDDSLFIFPGYHFSLKEHIANICASHNENFDWISKNLIKKDILGEWPLNAQFVSLILRIGDYLDLDGDRAPIHLYNFLSPKDLSDFSDAEWIKHFAVKNKEKISFNKNTKKKDIEFYGKSDDPTIHRKILKYFDLINNELIRAVELSEEFNEPQYLLNINTTVKNQISTPGFKFSNLKLSLEYNAVTSLLMGENIYGDKKYGLRELIQNSIDACKIMKERAKTIDKYKYNSYIPSIDIIFDKDDGSVIIKDNGQGMSIDILQKYFLNVGVSYYRSSDYIFNGINYSPIGNYGIGFLSCFMLSEKVVVKTKFFDDADTNELEIEKNSEYICLKYSKNIECSGTEIFLNYDQFISVFINIENVEKFILMTFLDCEIPINIKKFSKIKPKEKNLELPSLNSVLSQRPKIRFKIPHINAVKIELNNYLDDIETVILFENHGSEITCYENFSDINFNESNYIYQDKDNILISSNALHESVLLKDYIVDDKIIFLKLPIISDFENDDFQQAYEVYEDFHLALERVSYYNANIFARDPQLFNASSLIESEIDYILGDFSFFDFIDHFDHPSDAPTYTHVVEKNVIHDSSNLILPYKSNNSLYSTPSLRRNFLYVNNVFISNLELNLPFLIEGPKLTGIAINILNKNIVPNVSRSNINVSDSELLTFAIGKAFHIWLYDNYEMKPEKRKLLKKFLNTLYSEKNILLKDEYQIIR